MTPAAWATIIAALLGGGLISALLDWRRSRRQEPIEKRDAHVAAADTLQQMAMKAAENAAARATAAMTEAQEARAEGRADRARIAALERAQEGMRELLRRWEAFGVDLHARWPYHRAQVQPPPLPHVVPDDGQDTDPSR